MSNKLKLEKLSFQMETEFLRDGAGFQKIKILKKETEHFIVPSFGFSVQTLDILSFINYNNINMIFNHHKRTLIIYQDSKGKEPFVDWLESIKDINTKARIKNRLRRIELGNLGDCKSVGGKVFELRLYFGSGYRVYFGEIDNIIILLLCGGDKGSQKKDIKQAKEYWQDYINS